MRFAAAFMPEPGRIAVDEFELPTLGDDDVLVEMSHAGVCGSDVHVVHHGFHDPTRLGSPGYPGHEGVGTVLESRSSRVRAGDRVLTVPGVAVAGCFADLQVLPASNVITLPQRGASNRLLMSQQLGTILFALKRFLANRSLPEHVLILGGGPAGLLFAQRLIALGVQDVVVAEPQKRRREWGAALGASILEPDTSDDSLVEQLLELTNGLGVDLTIEASGTDLARRWAADATRVGGTVGLFGYPERNGLSPFPVQRAFRRALSMEWVSGTQQEPGLASFREAIELVADGSIDVDHCLQDVYPLVATERAISDAASWDDRVVKATIEMGTAPAGPSQLATR